VLCVRGPGARGRSHGTWHDLTVGLDGKVYVAAWGAGEVHRIHPSTGQTCRIATDLTQVTAVEAVPARNVPAPHFRLYATTALGDLFELTPPT
jgi:hypothetical protein